MAERVNGANLSFGVRPDRDFFLILLLRLRGFTVDVVNDGTVKGGGAGKMG